MACGGVLLAARRAARAPRIGARDDARITSRARAQVMAAHVMTLNRQKAEEFAEDVRIMSSCALKNYETAHKLYEVVHKRLHIIDFDGRFAYFTDGNTIAHTMPTDPRQGFARLLWASKNKTLVFFPTDRQNTDLESVTMFVAEALQASTEQEHVVYNAPAAMNDNGLSLFASTWWTVKKVGGVFPRSLREYDVVICVDETKAVEAVERAFMCFSAPLLILPTRFWELAETKLATMVNPAD